MKKIGLICVAVVAGLSLAGCNNLASQEWHRKHDSSSSTRITVEYSKNKSNSSHKTESSDKDDELFDIYDDTGTQVAVSGIDNINIPSIDFPDGSSINVQSPHLSSSIGNSTTPGGDPKVQAETARIQHDWNVKHGVENPDGSETQNFKNWVAKRDQVEATGQRMPDYDQNQRY